MIYNRRKPKKQIADLEELVVPTKEQIRNCQLFGWSYYSSCKLFEKENFLGYFTKNGFIKV